MSLFGSNWLDDSEDIGPFSHWKEDESQEYIGPFSHWREGEEILTTINFDGDLKIDSAMRKYDRNSEFKIIRRTKGGKYILLDSHGKEICLAKRNIEYFQK